MVSKVEAAFIILSEYKRPMSYTEIIEIAIKRNLISTKGKTPAQTLRVDIYHENMRRTKRGAELRFDISNNGLVDLY